VPDLSFSRALSFAQDLIRIQGPPGGEGDVARRILAEYQALGFDDAWIDEAGNAIGRIRGRGDAGTVMLSCHTDVVDIGDATTWEYAPFGGVVEGGFLHGRGAMDIKGPLALRTYAAAHFAGTKPAGDIVVAHTVLEERGGWGMEHLLDAGEIRPDAVIIGESTNGDICIGHRGRAELVIDIEGVAGHASAPDRASNSLDVLPQLLPLIAQFSRTMAPDPVLGAATLAATAVETLPSSYNVIPDIARVIVDWRVLPDTTADDAVGRLEAFLRAGTDLPAPFTMRVYFSTDLQKTWTGLERQRRMFTPGFLIDEAHPVATAAAQAIARSSGVRPAIRPWTFATDGGHSCGVHVIRTIGYAPGEERFAHTNRERLELSSAQVAYEAYPALIAAVQSAAPNLQS